MKIVLDMAGVLLTRSEGILAEILRSNHGISVKDYVNRTLIHGEDVTKGFSEEENTALSKSYMDTMKKTSRADIHRNTEIIRLLGKEKDVDIHLICDVPKDIGDYFVSEFSWEDCFSEIVFDAKRFGNKKFYFNYIESLQRDGDEPVTIIEDSFFHVVNTARLVSNNPSVKILLMFNPIYCFHENVNEEIIEILDRHENIVMVLNFYEIVSELFPLVFDFRKYLPYALASAPTLNDDLALSTILYKEVYHTRNYFHFDVLDDDSFSWVTKRDFFIIFSLLAKDINNDYNKILMKMDFGTGHVRWLLPGGGLRPERDEDYIDLLFKKIHGFLLDKQGIEIRNLYPICNLTNIFVNQDRKTHVHYGIGWIGFISSPTVLLDELLREIDNFENSFRSLSEIHPEDVLQETSKNALKETVVSRRDFRFEHEGKLKPWGMLIHRLLIKRIFSIFKNHKRFIREKIKETQPVSLLDISCGDDKDIVNYIKDSHIKVVVLNDVSEESVLEMKDHISKNKSRCPGTVFLFTMQDATDLVNYRQEIFDFAMCKNTLHHFPSMEEKDKCLEQLARVSRERILVMDVEYPKSRAESSGIWKPLVLLIHWYYMNVIGESGPEDVDTAFLSYSDFRSLIDRNFPDKRYDKEFKRINSPRAAYMTALITRRNNWGL